MSIVNIWIQVLECTKQVGQMENETIEIPNIFCRDCKIKHRFMVNFVAFLFHLSFEYFISAQIRDMENMVVMGIKEIKLRDWTCVN